MTPILFQFDIGPCYRGMTDGTRWNGFLNVCITPETRDAIAAAVKLWDNDTEGLVDFRALPIGKDGLIDLSNGYATYEASPCDKFQVGDVVRFTRHCEAYPNFLIPAGTLGEVTYVDGDTVMVRPDKGDGVVAIWPASSNDDTERDAIALGTTPHEDGDNYVDDMSAIALA